MFCSCDKQDSSEGGSDIFESQMVNLSSDKQIIDIKASETHWYMRVKEVEESMNQQLDTIRGNWYTLIKKNGGDPERETLNLIPAKDEKYYFVFRL